MFDVIALELFKGDPSNNELSFEKNQLIHVKEALDNDHYIGEYSIPGTHESRSGKFPKSCVEVLHKVVDEHVESPPVVPEMSIRDRIASMLKQQEQDLLKKEKPVQTDPADKPEEVDVQDVSLPSSELNQDEKEDVAEALSASEPEEEPSEAAKKQSLVERMARLAGAGRQGGGFNPFGMPVSMPPKKSSYEPVEEDSKKDVEDLSSKRQFNIMTGEWMDVETFKNTLVKPKTNDEIPLDSKDPIVEKKSDNGKELSAESIVSEEANKTSPHVAQSKIESTVNATKSKDEPLHVEPEIHAKTDAEIAAKQSAPITTPDTALPAYAPKPAQVYTSPEVTRTADHVDEYVIVPAPVAPSVSAPRPAQVYAPPEVPRTTDHQDSAVTKTAPAVTKATPPPAVPASAPKPAQVYTSPEVSRTADPVNAPITKASPPPVPTMTRATTAPAPGAVPEMPKTATPPVPPMPSIKKTATAPIHPMSGISKTATPPVPPIPGINRTVTAPIPPMSGSNNTAIAPNPPALSTNPFRTKAAPPPVPSILTMNKAAPPPIPTIASPTSPPQVPIKTAHTKVMVSGESGTQSFSPPPVPTQPPMVGISNGNLVPETVKPDKGVHLRKESIAMNNFFPHSTDSQTSKAEDLFYFKDSNNDFELEDALKKKYHNACLINFSGHEKWLLEAYPLPESAIIPVDGKMPKYLAQKEMHDVYLGILGANMRIVAIRILLEDYSYLDAKVVYNRDTSELNFVEQVFTLTYPKESDFLLKAPEVSSNLEKIAMKSVGNKSGFADSVTWVDALLEKNNFVPVLAKRTFGINVLKFDPSRRALSVDTKIELGDILVIKDGDYVNGDLESLVICHVDEQSYSFKCITVDANGEVIIVGRNFDNMTKGKVRVFRPLPKECIY